VKSNRQYYHLHYHHIICAALAMLRSAVGVSVWNVEIRQFPSSHLQVGSKISRKSTKSDTDMWQNILAARTMQLWKKQLKLLNYFKNSYNNPKSLPSFSNMNKGKKKINKCKDLKNKLNFTASSVIIDIMIKKHLIQNWTPAAHVIGKRTSNWTISENVNVPTFMKLMNEHWRKSNKCITCHCTFKCKKRVTVEVSLSLCHINQPYWCPSQIKSQN
jgi:hypothetical protein